MIKLDLAREEGSDSGSDTLSQLAMEAGLERPQRRNSGLSGQLEGKERVEEGKEEEGCYTNNSFFSDNSRQLTKWFSQQDVTAREEAHGVKGSCDTISTALDLRRRRGVRRLVDKGGQIRVQNYGLPDQNVFFRDIFTTAIDIRWRYTFLLFTTAFLLSWLGFAGLWHFTFWLHGDLEMDHLPDGLLQGNGSWVPCVFQIHDFTSSFLYSLETQHTIGYGLRGSSHKCWDTVMLQCLQSILGVVIQASMAGIFFAKLSRPKARSSTVLYSEKAAISLRNGLLRLMFRVANVRSSQLLESHFTAVVLGQVTTREGELLRNQQTRLDLSVHLEEEEDGPMDYGHLMLPLVVSHTITQHSPLYRLAPKDLLNSRMEIVVTLEGVVEPTGNTVQVRTSYLPEEIQWGYHFSNCVNYVKKENIFAVDLSKLNSLKADDTPRLSAAQLCHQQKAQGHTEASSQGKHDGSPLGLESCGTAIKMIDEE